MPKNSLFIFKYLTGLPLLAKQPTWGRVAYTVVSTYRLRRHRHHQPVEAAGSRLREQVAD